MLRNTSEAIRYIRSALPAELKALSRWTFALDLLVEAETTGKKRDMNAAYRQLRQALENDRLLVEAVDPDEQP